MVRSVVVVAALTAWVSHEAGGARPDPAPVMRELQDTATRRLVEAAREQALSGGLSLDAATIARLMGAGTAPAPLPTAPPTGARPRSERETPPPR